MRPDEQHKFVSYGNVIHDSRMYQRYTIFWYWEMSALLDDGMLSELQPPRWKHAFYGMYVWFWIYSDGIGTSFPFFFQACFDLVFGLVLCWHLLADLDSHTVCTIKMKIHSSCEIEDFVETTICKLWVILRSREVQVLCPY